MEENQSVISVDTKKKELIGNYKNNGKEYCRKGLPIEVNDHDFGSERIAPYGIYDINNNEGYVNIGKSADTGAFAVRRKSFCSIHYCSVVMWTEVEIY